MQDLLAGAAEAHRARRCSVCKNEKLAAAVLHFLVVKAEGNENAQVPFSWFYRERLLPAFGGPGARTARDHVAACLKRDIETGKVNK